MIAHDASCRVQPWLVNQHEEEAISLQQTDTSFRLHFARLLDQWNLLVEAELVAKKVRTMNKTPRYSPHNNGPCTTELQQAPELI